MKILLKDASSGLWLSRDGEWKASSHDAWEFNSCPDAIKYCVATKKWQVQVILRFRRLDENVDIPLEEASFSVAPPIRTVQGRIRGAFATATTERESRQLN